MNINCVICSDLFMPSDEVYVTQCGHVFHFTCLMNWLERSKTCPQCRNKTTERTIYRLFLNVATNVPTEDAATLQHKLENAQFSMKMKDETLQKRDVKYKEIKSKNAELRGLVKQLEDKLKLHDSVMHALKDQIKYFKDKAKETDRLTEEIIRLKNRFKDMENVQTAIEGSRDEVNNMIRHEHNIESLALLAATLKKSLVDTERRKRDTESKLKKALNEITSHRRETSKLQTDNAELMKELEYLKIHYEKEKSYLKKKLADLDERISSRSSVDLSNTTLKRIITESPVNYSRKSDISALDLTETPPIKKAVENIINSDSPYLTVKPNSLGVNTSSILNTKFITNSKPEAIKSKYTIFKHPSFKLDDLEVPKTNHASGVSYDGFGGSKKEDVFPTPKQTGLKRHKSSTSVSSSKFRKLSAASKSNTKLTSFLNKDTFELD